MEISQENIYSAWKSALTYIMGSGTDFKDKDERMCREVLNLCVEVKNPQEDIEKPIDSMRQYEFIYPSKEELTAIMFNKEESSGYEYSYGPRIFGHKDQINDVVIPLLKKDPTSRRAIVALFDPQKDSAFSSKNIPSLMYLYFKIFEDQLCLTCFIRSNDFFIGWPGNIYQVFMLHKYVATRLGIPLGSLTTICGSAHLYHEHFDMIKKITQA